MYQGFRIESRRHYLGFFRIWKVKNKVIENRTVFVRLDPENKQNTKENERKVDEVEKKQKLLSMILLKYHGYW